MTEDAKDETGDETASPDPGKGKGKKSKGSTVPTSPGGASTEAELLAQFGEAEEKVARAKQAVLDAEAERTEATRALGAFLVPPGAKRNDRFQFWTGTGEQRRCLTVLVGKDGGFTIEPYRGGQRPA